MAGEMLPPLIATLTADIEQFKAAMLEAARSEEGLVTSARRTGKDLDSAHRDIEAKTSGFSGRMQSLFSGLGTAAGNWGIPFAGSVQKMGDKIGDAEKKGQGFSASMAAVGKVALVAGVAGFAIAGEHAVRMAGDFQSAAEHLVTDAGESQSALGQITKGMLDLSAQTGTTQADIVNGMYHIESAGFHGKAGLELLKTAAEGAKVGGADLDTVAQTLTGTMRAYNIPASESVSVMNQLIAAVGSGDMRMQDLASSLGNVAPVAAAAGISLAQVGGAIATMTAQNMSAQQATQDLAGLIRSLQAPSETAVKEMAQFGLNAQDVASNLGKKGLTGTLDELTQAITSKMGPGGKVLFDAFNQSMGAAKDMQVEISKMPPALQTLASQFENGKMTMGQWRAESKKLPADQRLMMQGFMSTYSEAHKFNDMLRSGSPDAQTYSQALEKLTGGATGLNTALMLSGGNAEAFHANVNAIGEAAKKTGKNVDNWNQIQKTFNQQTDEAKQTVAKYETELGMALIPVIQTTAHGVADLVGWFQEHKAVAEALAITVGSVLAVAVGAYAVNGVAKLVHSVQDAVKNLGEFAGKVGDVATTVLQKFGLIGQGSEQMASTVEQSAAGMEATVEADTTGMAAAVEADVTGMETAVDSEMAAGAAGAEATVSAETAAVDADFAKMAATAATETAAVEGDAAAAEGAMAGLGAVAGGAAGLGAIYFGSKYALQASGQGEQKILNSMNPQQLAEWASLQASGQNIAPSAFMKTALAQGNVSNSGTGPSPLTKPGAESMTPGHRAVGGPVDMGMPYVVGEHGPELFVPSAGGYIVPNGGTSGGAASGMAGGSASGSPITLNVTTHDVDTHELVREIQFELRPYLASAGF